MPKSKFRKTFSTILSENLPRDRFLDIIRSLLGEFDPEKTYSPTDVTWFSGVVAGCSRLHLPELDPEIKYLFDQEIVDPMWLRYEHFQEACADPEIEAKARTSHQYTPVASAVEELRGWACFHRFDQKVVRKPPKISPKALNLAQKAIAGNRGVEKPVAETVWAKHRGVGRNDPCPCGSGKKYKEGCLG